MSNANLKSGDLLVISNFSKKSFDFFFIVKKYTNFMAEKNISRG